jgi:hypothetical protein
MIDNKGRRICLMLRDAALATQRFFAAVLQLAWNTLRNGIEVGTANAFPTQQGAIVVTT